MESNFVQRGAEIWVDIQSPDNFKQAILVTFKIAYKLSRFLAACEMMQYSGIGISAILASPWGAAFARERPVRNSKKIAPKL